MVEWITIPPSEGGGAGSIPAESTQKTLNYKIMEENNKKSEFTWQPYGMICKQCGAPNPDGHDICGGCGEKANEFKDGNLTKEQHEKRETIKKALR